MSETKTEVEQVTTDDLDNLLGMPGAGNVIIPTGSEAEPAPDADPEKPKFFQTKDVDLSVLDGAPDTDPVEVPVITDEMTDEEKAAAEAKIAEIEDAKPKETFDDLVDKIDEEEDGEGDGKGKPGRPSLDKGGMAQLAQSLIDDGTILPFDEDKDLADYTEADFKELFKVNLDQVEQKVQAETPKQFFDALPEELQYAAKYVADGGKDLKGLFKALATSEENKAISTDTERGQEAIARQFLEVSGFGTTEEIQEEIDSWKDLGRLEQKATQFKPKLDKMQDQVLQQKIREQEVKKKQQEESSMQYADSIYNTLSEGDLGGLKMSNKVQNMLYQGLIQPNYQSVDGSQTNLFGHLIEKHQFVEPNHGLIAEALWLLADPEGYKSEISKGTKTEVAKETARMLKTEQAQKNAGGSGDDPKAKGKGAHSRGTLQRPTAGFFKR